jgi:hypothetical protein
MLALSLLLIVLGIALIHAAITGRSLSDLIRGTSSINASKEPTLGV